MADGFEIQILANGAAVYSRVFTDREEGLEFGLFRRREDDPQFDELMAAGGRYHTMFELQASRFGTEEDEEGVKLDAQA